MKKLTLILIALMATFIAGAQVTPGVAINTDGSNAHPSAILDLQSSEQGFLIPRMTLIERNNISEPAHGLLIYQTNNDPGFYYNAGTPSSPNWQSIGGNAGTNCKWTSSGNNIFYNQGNVGINTENPTERLSVNGNGRFGSDSYQIVIGDKVIDNEIGLIDPLVDRLIAGKPNDLIDLLYQYGGVPGTNEGLFINTGNVGIGIDSPTQMLDVNGQMRLRGGNPGEGKILTSNADGVASWEALPSITESDPTWSGDANTTGSIGRAGNVGIGTEAPLELMHVNNGNFLVYGVHNSGPELNISGSGTKMFFYPRKSAFRAGRVTASHWDDNNIGNNSSAIGYDVIANAGYSTAIGTSLLAGGTYSLAMGYGSQANGTASTAMGRNARAVGDYSFAIHLSNTQGPEVPANTFQISGASKTIISEGNIGIGTSDPNEKLHLSNGNLLTTGTHGSSPVLNVSGTGTKMFFYPRKSAFRAGYTEGEEWNNAGIGDYSAAFGHSTAASGSFSFAAGSGAAVSGNYSVAMGTMTQASGAGSVAMGSLSTASGDYSVAMGEETTASSSHSVALGYSTEANGLRSVALGDRTIANGAIAFAAGRETLANGQYSTAMGSKARANGDYSFAINLNNETGPLVQDHTFHISGATNTIISDGNVGIGTNNPLQLLHVNGNAVFGQVNLVGIGYDFAGGESGLIDYDYDMIIAGKPGFGNPYLYKYGGSASGENGLFINSESGSVGIGVSSPTTRLDVNGQLRIRGGSPGVNKVLTSDANGLASWEELPEVTETDPTWSGSANTTADIGRTGNVGIGTNSPAAKLHVDGGDAIIHGHTIGRGGGSQTTNFAAGTQPLSSNTTGVGNTAIGQSALSENVSGDYNTAVGGLAGVIKNNNRCTFIGYAAYSDVDVNNAIAIGHDTRATASNQVRLGNNLITSLYCRGAYWGQVGGTTQRDLYVDDNFKIGYLSSSKRAMENTRDIESVNWLYELKPVSFNFINDETRSLRFGLIAEEVEKIAPQFVSYNDDGLPETVSYSALITPLLKALQEQQKIIQEQQRQIDALMQRVGMMEN